MTLFEKENIAKDMIYLAVKAFPKIFISCSFGKDSRVLLDLTTKVDPDIEVIGIDTGYEFPETLDFGNKLVDELNLNFKWVTPSKKDQKEVHDRYGDSFVQNGQYKCCEMKIPAITTVLGKYDAWVTGLRRDETENRKNVGMIEFGKIAKVNPLAYWTKDDIWAYIEENKLTYHPLYDQGYPSLGCKPCTTEGATHEGGGRQGQFERAGRFIEGGDSKECGLHTYL